MSEAHASVRVEEATDASSGDDVDTVVIDVDKPKTGNGITVEVWELDRAEGEQETDADLLATFTIDVGEDGTEVKDVVLAEESKDAKRFGSVRVRFAGSDADPVTIPVLHDRTGEQDALSTDLGIVVKAPGHDDYSTLETQDLTDVPHATPVGPVVAFLIQPTSQDGFYEQAYEYWRDRADEVVRPKKGHLSLVKILQHLATPPGELGEDYDVPYHEVNLISHGSASGFLIGLTDEQEPEAQSALALRQFSFSEDLERIGADTRVVIRGCVVGRDGCLLNALEDIFSPAHVVMAPKHVLTYHTPEFKGDRPHLSTRELLREELFVYGPGLKSLWTPKGKRQEIADLLEAKYGPQTFPAGGFMEMLGKSKSDWGKGLGHYFREFRQEKHEDMKFRFSVDKKLTEKERAGMASDREADLKALWTELAERDPQDDEEKVFRYTLDAVLGSDPEAYQWIYKKAPFDEAQSLHTFQWEIVRTKLMVRRIMISDPGDPPTKDKPLKNLVTPSLADPDHFGSSGGDCVLD